MTPAKLGITCCPVVNLDDCLDSDNINMISCGGQASMPMCLAIKRLIQILSISRWFLQSLRIRRSRYKENISGTSQLKMPPGICLIYLQLKLSLISPGYSTYSYENPILIDSDAIISESKTKLSIQRILLCQSLHLDIWFC